MHAIVAKADLQRMTAMTERACNTKSSLPILATLALSTDGQTLQATGSDLELTLTAAGAVTEGSAGGVAVIAAMLADVVKGLPNGPVELKWEGQGPLLVRSGRSRYKVPTVAGEQMPTLPAKGEETHFTVPGGALKAALNQVLPALATDETRPSLSGMLWRLAAGRLQLIGTDAHRLHVAGVSLEASSGTTEVIVPARVCRELERLLGPEEAVTVWISPTNGTLAAEGPWGSLVARLTAAQYPQWEKILPQGAAVPVTFDKAELAAAVKRAAVVAAGCSDRLELQLAGETVNIHCECEELGEALEGLSTARGTAGRGRVAFSSKYLHAAVSACPEEEVTLYTGEPTDPVRIAGDNEERFLAVVMPMRLLGG